MHHGIAAGHIKTYEVAESVLSAGGNAFDALVASYLSMAITEPAMASAGAGGFVNIHTGDNQNYILDFFCQTPLINQIQNRQYEEIKVDFGAVQELFYAGPASMAVSGAIAMIMYFHKQHCTIPLKELVKPAQELATKGVEITPFQSLDLHLLESIFKMSETGRKIFCTDQNEFKDIGDSISMPDYSLFLDALSTEKPDWFYNGEIAQTVSKYCTENGGYLRYEDFRNYKLIKSRPFLFDFNNYKISVPGLPSMGGGIMSLFLHDLSEDSISSLSADHLELLQSGFSKCKPFLRDSHKLKSEIEKSLNLALPGPAGTDIQTGGTSHLCISDQWGNAISLSTSIGEGSGYFIPGTDIQMNNMLGETALLPNGLDSWKANQRLNSMMAPTLVFDSSGEVKMALGSGGATRIPFSIGQVLYNHLALKLSLEDSIVHPRVYVGGHGMYLESGFDESAISFDGEIKRWDKANMVFGGVHSIDIQEKVAVGDDRREGFGKFTKA